MCQIRVNGQQYDVPDGGSVLDALRAVGIGVPSLCHDDRIAPTGVCRTCLVQISGMPKPVPACTTPASAGMDIVTATPALESSRLSVLGMLARHYPAAAVRTSPDKPFHQELRHAGLLDDAGIASPSDGLADVSHPYIAVDMTRCIECYRCVRICAEVEGQFVWHVRGRGDHTVIRPDGPTLRESACVSCGACVDTCPTGALEDRSLVAGQAVSSWTQTTCPYCGVGCEMRVGVADGRIVTIRPLLRSLVSKGHLCVKGRYAFGFTSAQDRVTSPMIRRGSTWRRVTWDEALAHVSDRLASLRAAHGPDSIGILGSARATNEDNYVAQKLARAVIGTNNIDCCARVCHAPSATALKSVLGAGLATNSFDDIERARAILICGANATESHPVVGARIKQAALRGTPLIVIDPREIELARGAAIHLQLRPGTNVALLNAMTHVIVIEGLYDRPFVATRVASFDAFASFIAQWTPERAAAICGVDAELIRRAARLYAAASPAMILHGLGVTEQVQGTDGVTALINLALLTGNVGKPGSGINPLRGQNNVQGAAHMGCDPQLLPGSMPIDAGRHACETVWGTPVPRQRGLHVMEMMDAASEGLLKALWIIGYDVLLTHPDMLETLRSLRALELVVVQDLFLTETAREVATVFLPACSSFEKEGTFMNAERRIQRVRAALPPRGASRPDWRILCDVARALGGRGFDFASAEDIWNEVRAVCDGARGMAYTRLESGGLQWPCPTHDHPGTSLLHQERFAIGPRALLTEIDFRESLEVPTPEYPLRLVTGRSLYQFNAGTMTGRTPNIVLRPADTLDVSPDDAERRHIGEGDVVTVTSRYGSARLPAHIDAAVRPGDCFATFQQPSTRLNRVTGPGCDPVTGTPEYKVTAVRVERHSGRDRSDATSSTSI